MFAPAAILLEEGSYIYRFASSTAAPGRPSPAVVGYHAGAWWIHHEDFDAIMERAKRSGTDLGQTARWDLSVLHKWGSRMNVAVEARVADRIWAWTGLAKPQQEEAPNGKIIRMFGNSRIKQLYLCGVVDRFGMLTPRGRHTLAVTGAKVIPSSDIF
jgi:hypothetical protein